MKSISTYAQLNQRLEDRKKLLEMGLQDFHLLDDGLHWVLSFTDAIGGAYKRGRSIDDICYDFGQARKGKGFHTMSAFGVWFATEEVLNQAFNGELLKGQEEGCWEHVQPFTFTLKRIKKELETNGFDEITIAKLIIDGTVKCFVSKKENIKLKKAGLERSLPERFTSIFDRYDIVGIKPLALVGHDFNVTTVKNEILKLAKKTKETSAQEFIAEITE